jgi:hypothetical protein
LVFQAQPKKESLREGDTVPAWNYTIEDFVSKFAYSTSHLDHIPAALAHKEPFNDSVTDPKSHGLLFGRYKCSTAEARASNGVFRILLGPDEQTSRALTIGEEKWAETVIAPRDSAVTLSMEWFKPGSLFSRERRMLIAEPLHIPVDRLAGTNVLVLEFPVLPAAKSATEFSVPSVLKARLEVAPWGPDWERDTESLDVRSVGWHAWWSSRRLSYLKGRSKALIDVPSKERYLAVAAIGNAPFKRRLIIRRRDNGNQIGEYSPEFPLLLACAGGRTSMQIQGICREPGDSLDYRLLAVSDDRDPRKALFFNVLAELTNRDSEKLGISKQDVDHTVVWMVRSLGIELTRDDVREAATGKEDSKQALTTYFESLGVLR